MSHDHLLDTYDFIQQQLDDALHHLTQADADPTIKQYASGRIEALCDLERFLTHHYHAKLPRRLRSRVPLTSAICDAADSNAENDIKKEL